MNRIQQALVLFALAGSAAAGDLVLKLGTAGSPVYHRIPVTGNVTISPSTGDIIVDPVAEAGAGGDGWCPTTGGTPAPVFNPNLTVSTANLPFGGGSVQLSWGVTNATNCSASANPAVTGWSGNVTSPTTVNLTATGTYTFSLSCTGAGGTTAATPLTVTVAPDTPPPTACTNRPPVNGLSRQTAMVNNPRFPENNEFNFNASIDLTRYNPLLGTFPQVGQSAYAFIDTNKYIAMEFSTTGVANGVFGGVSWEQPATNGAPLWVMISECPGDFEWMNNNNCRVHGGASTLTWWVGTGAPSWVCKLDQNKTYYLNAVYSSTGSYTDTSCRDSNGSIMPNCHWFITSAGRENTNGTAQDM
jgi:hypothetical protein